jgi:acetyl-CoA acetyltransferase
MVCWGFPPEPDLPLFVLSACRTPLGALGGAWKDRTAPELAGAALRHLLAAVDPARVEACVLGQAVQAGAGPNPAREAARLGGLPPGASAFTVNQGLASGLQAVLLASLGEADLAASGGMESASAAPYLLPTARWGTRMGSAPVLDALLRDAQWPRWEGSAERAPGSPQAELAGPGQDEAASEPGPADGAAVVLLGSERAARDLPPLARIVAWAQGEGEAGAIRRALAKAGLAMGRLDRFELDDPTPFPGLPPEAVRAWGSPASVALGAEGARKVVTLAHQLKHGNLRYGLASLEAGGLGLALILERT